MLDLITSFQQYRDKRVYSKLQIEDLDIELRKEIKKIEDKDEDTLMNVLHKEDEKIIVYRTILDKDEEYGLFFIKLKVINIKGLVLNRIRLSANYTSEQEIELGDIEVFGENSGRGYGSILLSSLTVFAKENSIKKISGWLSYADSDHFDKLDSFYRKHNFKVYWHKNNSNPLKAADIYWKE